MVKKMQPPSFQSGVFHFVKKSDQSKVRIHLRVEEDKMGLLLVNASRVFHLNPSATWMALNLLQEKSSPEIISSLMQIFHVTKNVAKRDLLSFSDQFSQLIDPAGLCPIHDLNLETNAPFSHTPSAPYRMDLAVTYRCNNDCHHCYNERSRAKKELITSDWESVLSQLWEVGIPHIIFTGGEPTLREDLVDLIAYAEKLGQITGINTNGRKLKEPEYVQTLIHAGLDHIQITLESHKPAIHDEIVHHQGAWKDTTLGIRNAVSEKLFVMTNTTLLKTNSPFIGDTLNYLADLGVTTVGLNALIHSGKGAIVGTGLQESELTELLGIAKETTQKNKQKLIWYTPTQYCHFDPIMSDLGVKGCTAALYNMCIEPDGNILPCQSYYQSLGKLSETSWSSIWNHPLARSLRERKNVPIKCLPCPVLTECGGGCPLVFQKSKPLPNAILTSIPALIEEEK